MTETGIPTDYERSCLSSGHAEEHGRAVRDVLSRVGDKWSLLVIVTLGAERLRFTELLRHIPGISQRMLTLTVRHLERDGLVARTVHAGVPPRVEYEPTPLGATLIHPAVALAQWAIDNRAGIEQSRTDYDAAHAAPRRAQA